MARRRQRCHRPDTQTHTVALADIQTHTYADNANVTHGFNRTLNSQRSQFIQGIRVCMLVRLKFSVLKAKGFKLRIKYSNLRFIYTNIYIQFEFLSIFKQKNK